MPRKPKKLPRFMRDDEPEAILKATATQRDRLLLLTALYFGLRCAELCKLEVEDLDFGRRMLTVRQGKGKKDRVVPIAARMVGPLRGWIGGRREGYVFPSPRGGALTSRAVQLLVKRLAVKAGLHGAKEARRFTPHKYRHVFASRLLETGSTIFEVKELLGHSSIATTQLYLHSNPQKLAAAVNRL